MRGDPDGAVPDEGRTERAGDDGAGPATAELIGRLRRRARPSGARETVLTTDDPLGLFLALEKSGRFRRDTTLGGIFHRRTVSFREISPRDSLHISIQGNRVSAHVDHISPLNCEPDTPRHYSLPAVIAHNLAGVRADLTRLLLGRQGEQRCNLECEIVWVDEEDVVDTIAAGVDAGPADGEDQPASAGADEAHAPQALPFSAIDEAVHLLDTEAAPWSIQLEARVPGRIDESRLRDAIAYALGRHPMARARKRASRRVLRRDTWEVPPAPDLDPLRVVECPDDEALAAVRAELQSLAVPLVESPPLRVRLARNPGGDVVMFNVNHAAMDGFGALRVLRSVASAYAGADDPLPAVDFLQARAVTSQAATAGFRTRARRYAALAEKLRDLVAPPARLAPAGADGEAGYGFHHVALPAEDTAALLDLDHGGTVNDVLLAALHLAISGWNEEQRRRPRRIGVLVPANLRPQQWRQEMVGNFSLPARLSTSRRDRRDRWTALAALTARTRRKKETGLGTALVTVLEMSPLLPLWAKQVLVMLLPLSGNRLVDTAMLSNLGAVDAPSFAEAGDASELWFSPPARMPLGLAVGAVTVSGRLHLSFRYRRRLFDAAAARRFAERYVAELQGFIGDGRTR